MPNAGDDEVEGCDAASPTDAPGAPDGGGAKASKKAAKAEKRETAMAAKTAKREARAAKQAAARAARKAAAKTAKAERVAKKASKAAEKVAKQAAGEARKVAEAAFVGAPGPVVEPEPGRSAGKDRARAIAGKASGMAVAAGSVLSEVAGLVRQASQPAAARIVDRVTGRPGAEPGPEAVEPEAAEPGPEAVEPEAVEPEAAVETIAVEVFEVGTIEVAPAFEPAAPEPEAVEPEAADTDDAPESAAADQVLAPDHEAVGASPEDVLGDLRSATAWPALDEDLISLESAQPEPEPASPEPEPEPAPEPAPEPEAPATAPLLIEIPPGAVIGAAIDVGATSVHLLVAAVGGHRVEPLLDESVFLGLGDRVAAHGRLGPDAREELVAALVGYAETARQLGASRITVVGTEPMRRADDAATIVNAVEMRARVPLHILDHDEEGLLMLLGVTKGRPITSNLLVVDVGGGSTEFVVVDPAGHEHAMGLALGAARLTRDLVRSDPPSLAELEALKVRVREILVDAPGVNPGEIVAVGGTASNLLKLLPATALDRVLTRRRLTVALAMLTVERSLEAAERHLVRPARARILPAGAIIVDAILERYGADRLRVSEEGIREGLALAAAAAGPAWRDRLPHLVRGWSDEDWPLE